MEDGMQDATQPPAPTKAQQRHPIHTIQDILNNTPPDMIEHEYKQGADGSIEIKIKIPGRAEQAKQRAMQQAEQAMQQAGLGGMQAGQAGQGGSQPAKPSGNVVPMRGEQDQQKAAGSNVVVKIAMTTKDVAESLRARYPEAFLKRMNLI